MPKDKTVKTSEGKARIKPIKNLGGGVQAFTVKHPDGSTNTNRFENGKQTDMNYVPKKMKVKKMRKKRVTKPKLIKPGPTPSYTSKALDFTKEEEEIMAKQERINKYNKKKKKKVKTKRPKRRSVKNLITGKTNKIQ